MEELIGNEFTIYYPELGFCNLDKIIRNCIQETTQSDYHDLEENEGMVSCITMRLKQDAIHHHPI